MVEGKELEEKYQKLCRILESCGSLAVAFSSGVDSAFLLETARRVLGDRLLALTATGPWFPVRESAEAEEFCLKRGIRRKTLALTIQDIPGFAENPADRCYICKKALFSRLREASEQEGCAVLAEGSNMDDLGDYRPGLRAIAELNVRSPLREAGLYKEEIRLLSAHLGLETASKPSYACLASRFPYGDRITREGLKMVEEGEELLIRLGFRQMRVRIHGNLARVELPQADMADALKDGTREAIVKGLKDAGFTYVSLDLAGYRTGSMNETLA
jgi:uncharacterized protein